MIVHKNCEKSGFSETDEHLCVQEYDIDGRIEGSVDMHYVMGDIHNDIRKLRNVLDQINISINDYLIILGDVFDRGGENADPVGVYHELMKIQGKCIWIRGNHDQWLADYIEQYFSVKKKRDYLSPYHYNSFELISKRITEVDLLELADLIHRLPIQKEIKIEEKTYLFAHAMTSNPNVVEDDEYYLMGNNTFDDFLSNGIDGYISMVGHTTVSNYSNANKIWRNKRENVVLMDCGCGFGGGRLACLCIENGKEYYSMWK